MFVITYLLFLSSMLVQAKNTKGFTLVELIVVITILAILATIGFLSLQGYTSDAKETKTLANLRTVASSLVNESAVTGNSFGYYVSTGTNAMASGTYQVYGSTGVALNSGNYVAGKLDAAKLRIDGSKFFDKKATGGATEAFRVGSVTVNETANGKTRQRSVFQVAGTLKGTTGSTALVEGTYATGAVNDLNGLIAKDGTTNNGTAADAVIHAGTVLPYTLD